MKDIMPDLLIKELKLLDDSASILKYSYEKCKKIGIQENYVIEEMDQFEAFTSRFVVKDQAGILRLCDLNRKTVFSHAKPQRSPRKYEE